MVVFSQRTSFADSPEELSALPPASWRRFDLLNKATGGTVGFGSDAEWQISPGFKFSTLYDSNINREPPGKRDEEIISAYSPLVEINRYGTRFGAEGSYELRFEEFLRDTSQSSFNHIAGAQLRFTGTRLRAFVDERFQWVKTYATSEQSERRTIMIQDVNPHFDYRLTPKFSVGALYRNLVFDYKESVLDDRSYLVHEMGGRVYYHMRPKLDLYVQGSGLITDYYRSAIGDSKGFSVVAGSTGRLTKKVLLDVKTGFKGERYGDSTINPFNNWVLQGTVHYRLTAKTNIFLSAVRDKQESVYRNAYWYEGNRLGLDVNHRLTPRISVAVGSSIQRNRYSRETTEGGLTKRRGDYILKAGAGFNWRLSRHFSVSVAYDMRRRFSNFDNTFDYVSNAVDASVSYKF